MTRSFTCALMVGTVLAVGALALMPGQVRAEAVATQEPVVSPDQTAVRGLIATMQIDQVIEVLRAEGVEYGASIEEEMFPGMGGAAWKAAVADIYDTDKMKSLFAAKLAEALGAKTEAVAQAQEFFASPLGQRTLALELEARRALLDDEAEAAAQLAWDDLEAEGGARAGMLRRFAEVNDLVDSNVMGALNSNLAFYQGMAGTGAFGQDMSEGQILADVWVQEPDIREQTEEWVFPYLNLAYSSLSEAELTQYVEFSESDAGQALNVALFAAFDAVFVPISRGLGNAAALQLAGQDI